MQSQQISNQPSRQPTEPPSFADARQENDRLYLYQVAQRVLKDDAAGDEGIVRRVAAAEIEAAVVDQVRALLRQLEITAVSV